MYSRIQKGFLRSKQQKEEKKRNKSKSKSDGSGNDNSSIETNKDNSLEDSPGGNSEPKVDDEGYIIRPQAPFENAKDGDGFYSSSDEDSDSDDNRPGGKPIQFVIKPMPSNGGPSIDVLQKTVQGISISPSLQILRRQVSQVSGTSTPENGPLKRSVSQYVYKAESDLFSVFSNSTSNVSTPSTASEARNGVSNGSALSFEPTNGSVLNDSAPSSANTSEDRYAALSSLFTDSNKSDSAFGDSSVFTNSLHGNSSQPSLLCKSMSSSTVMGPPAPILARPPSKRSQPPPVLASQTSLTRTESYGSLSSTDFRMTPISSISIGSSRGPSPRTIGLNDPVPLAVAFQESISARFRGTDESRCQVQMFGSVKMAFPSGIVQVLASNPNPPPLTFNITNTSRIEKLYPNKEIVTIIKDSTLALNDHHSFEVNVIALIAQLRKLSEQTPSARYYNVDVIKYQLKNSGVKSCPLQVVSHWKCDPQTTGLKVEYKYNHAALSSMEPLKDVAFSVAIDSSVIGAQGKPQVNWNSAMKQATWTVDQISRTSSDYGIGSLRAKFDVTNGPSLASPVAIKFTCNNATLSGMDFEKSCTGYRVSLVKKTIVAGRYTSEADSNINYACI